EGQWAGPDRIHSVSYSAENRSSPAAYQSRRAALAIWIFAIRVSHRGRPLIKRPFCGYVLFPLFLPQTSSLPSGRLPFCRLSRTLATKSLFLASRANLRRCIFPPADILVSGEKIKLCYHRKYQSQ